MKRFSILDPSTWLRTGFRFSIVALLLFIAAPAFAQRDTVRMGEELSATVIKKKPAEKTKRKPRAPAGPKLRESLEIEHRTEAKETKGETK
jgi:hypothetical protein